MKHILVCVKAVPVSSSVEVDGQHRLKRDGASLQWNIADESALEAAFRLADRDGSVTVLTMGPPKLEGPLLELLARGANRAVLITDRLMAGADTRATARALASAAEKLGPFDAVFCGCKAIDGETGQVPGELAAALGLPCISNAEKVEAAGDELLVTRRLEDGVQNLTVSGPAVISFSSYSYPLRLAGILGMRRARKNPGGNSDSRRSGFDPGGLRPEGVADQGRGNGIPLPRSAPGSKGNGFGRGCAESARASAGGAAVKEILVLCPFGVDKGLLSKAAPAFRRRTAACSRRGG